MDRAVPDDLRHSTEHNTGLLNSTCMESCFHHRIKNIKGTCDFIYTFLTFFLTILRQDINLKFSEENFVRYKNQKLPFKNNNNKTELHNVKSEFSGKSLNCDIKI